MGDEPEPERRGDRLLGPLFRDPSLWPVAIVATLTMATFGAAVLVLALGDRNRFAMAAVAILLLVSADLVRSDVRRRRLGPLSGLVAAVWLLAVAAAVAALSLGLA